MYKFSKNLLKIGDIVYINTGKDKKKHGKLVAFDRKRGKVKIEGMNMKVHYFNKKDHGQSGMSKIEAWMDLSNINFFENNSGVRLSKNKDGKRISVKSKELV